jgi:hypothetical protein
VSAVTFRLTALLETLDAHDATQIVTVYDPDGEAS